MKRMLPHTLEPDWSLAAKRAPWSCVTSPELAQVLGVHLQTIANWRIRGILPEPEAKGRGNVVRYRISTIRAWLENRPAETIEWEWVQQTLADVALPSLDAAKSLLASCWDVFGLEKPYQASRSA